MEPPSRRLLFCGLNPMTLEKVTKPEMTHDFGFNSIGEAGGHGSDDLDNCNDEWELAIGWPHTVAINKATGDVKMPFTNCSRCLVGGNSNTLGAAKAAKNIILSTCFGFDLLYLLFDDGSLRFLRVCHGGDGEAGVGECDLGEAVCGGDGDDDGDFEKPSSIGDDTFLMGTPVSLDQATISLRKYLKTSSRERTSMAATDDGKLFIRWEKENVTEVEEGETGKKSSTRGQRGVVGYVDVTVMNTDENSTSPSPSDLSRLLPIDIQLGISRICCGKSHVLFLTSRGGEVLGLGSNSRGQLGLEGVFEISYDRCPERIEALEGVNARQIACGGWHSMALSEEGDAYCWGSNDCGQCAVPFERKQNECVSSRYVAGEKCEFSHRSTPSDEITKERNVFYETLANFDYGEQERLEPRSQTLPIPSPFEESIIDVAAGSRHSLFLMKNGTVFSCGSNKWGQLGRVVAGGEESDWRPMALSLAGRKIEKIWAGWWNSFLF